MEPLHPSASVREALQTPPAQVMPYLAVLLPCRGERGYILHEAGAPCLCLGGSARESVAGRGHHSWAKADASRRGS